QQFAASEYAARRMPKQVHRGVLAFVECGCGLETGVVDLVETVADRGGPLLRPVEVDVGSPTEELYCFRARHQDESTRFRDHCHIRTEVHAAVVHVARDAAAINRAEAKRCERQIEGRAEIDTPTGLVSTGLVIVGSERFVSEPAQDTG